MTTYHAGSAIFGPDMGSEGSSLANENIEFAEHMSIEIKDQIVATIQDDGRERYYIFVFAGRQVRG